MYEHYYGFAEKPFSLTPDPKYLYRSQPHASAFDLLQYAVRRREGFAVITGDIGTGKTTLCRALLEQIRILSNLETDKEKLLQIILVGQLNLDGLLRSPELRQLDQRVSIRYELTPLDRESVGAYITHRLTIAGGGQNVAFAPDALDEVHRATHGIPRLINLVCDRALLGGYSQRTSRITAPMIAHAAEGLELAEQAPPPPRLPRQGRRAGFARRNAPMLAAASVLVSAAVTGAAATAMIYERYLERSVHAQVATPVPSPASTPIAPARHRSAAAAGSRELPAEAALT